MKNAIVIEILGENYHQADIVGFGLVNEKTPIFIPKRFFQSSAFKAMGRGSGDEMKYVFDAKNPSLLCSVKMYSYERYNFDLLLASYLLNPSENNHDIPAISKSDGKKCCPIR